MKELSTLKNSVRLSYFFIVKKVKEGLQFKSKNVLLIISIVIKITTLERILTYRLVKELSTVKYLLKKEEAFI